tara:strand:+ start:293 stop:868 length:576 start_codon:yes stop_codon:yes gene_type:complete
MALRNSSADYFQNFRFHVKTIGDADFSLEYSQDGVGPGGIAGFQSCTIPEISVDAVEYREGTFKYTRKFGGIPTFSDVSLMRGVVNTDLTFYNWIMTFLNGGRYRADIQIDHYHVVDGDVFQTSQEDSEIATTPSRSYKCFNCIPIRCKIDADLDATATDVSVSEMDFALEFFEPVVNEVTNQDVTVDVDS